MASPTKSTSPTHEAMAKSQARSRKLSYRNSTLEEPLADLDDNQELEAVTKVEPPTRMISHHSSEYFSMSHSSDEYESEYAWQTEKEKYIQLHSVNNMYLRMFYFHEKFS